MSNRRLLQALNIPAAVAAEAAAACSPGTAARTTGAQESRTRIRFVQGMTGRSRVGQLRADPEMGQDTDRSQRWGLSQNHWPFDKR